MFSQLFRNRFGQNREINSPGLGGGRGFGRGASGGGGGQGGGNKPGSGPSGNCICPKCGCTQPHVAGQRCIDRICPKCGAKMIRE